MEIAEKTRYMECCSSTLDFDCSFAGCVVPGWTGPAYRAPSFVNDFLGRGSGHSGRVFARSMVLNCLAFVRRVKLRNLENFSVCRDETTTRCLD